MIVRELLPKPVCGAVRSSFLSHVKPYKGELLRQFSNRYQRHVFRDGLVVNSMLGIQDMPDECAPFVDAFFDLLGHGRLREALHSFPGPPKNCVDTMYFEGTVGNDPHVDSHYMDSLAEEMVAIWVAVEDIDPRAGRFFLYPGSHRLTGDRYEEYTSQSVAIGSRLGQLSVRQRMEGRARALRDLAGILRDAGLECHAPTMNAGDVVFWSSKLVHGGLIPADTTRSRHALTAHFVPEEDRLVQYGRVVEMTLKEVNGVRVRTDRRTHSV